ncbi:putative hydro-lyase [Terasakiella pusilla]|uniref:putative hydro-lyase n=1 Tax=Terasakiella pusilla TaxID=64973 RepID=UPI003AA7E8F7
MGLREKLQKATPKDVRQAIRSGEFTSDTAGLGGGYLQGNLAIMPAEYATDFLRFCQRNPKPCPLVGVSETGDPFLPTLGDDIDIRTDVPQYKIFKNGELIEQVTDIRDHWRDDLVTFVLGCSFSFEDALIAEGIEVRHITQCKTVPMFRTNIQTVKAGPFHGEVVVSMRSMSVSDAIRAIEITSRFQQAHGAPIHFGDPAAIGIKDVNKPDFGDPTEIKDGEVPVFWACGVTPQVAITNAKPSLCITHAPGHMLISDIRGADQGRITI